MAGKKFRFSLASVLNVRVHETERARRALAATITARVAQEQALEAARGELERLAHPEPDPHRAVAAGRLRQTDGLRRDAQRRIFAEQERLKERLREEREARQALVARRSAEKALETLRDLEKERFLQAEYYAENKRLEEQALDAYRRHHAARNP